MMMTARNTTTGTSAAGKKKPRKPYTISNPREKWTADEHDNFLHALVVFGRDWKTIEQFVGTKTATQIRSHAQKHFLKVHKLGLAAASLMVRRALSPTAGCARQTVEWAASCPASAGAARWPNHDDSFMATPNGGGGGSPSEQAKFADCLLQDTTAVQQPLLPDDLHFAEVYRFVGDIFGSGTPRPVEAQLQRLHGVDPVVAQTILLVLRNLEDNLCG